MSITAMKQALDALENNRQTHHYCEDPWYSCPKHEDGCANDSEGHECNCGADKANAEIDKAITSLRQAISEAEKREPVAWIDNSGHPKHMNHVQSISERKLYGARRPLYTTPQPAQKPWVGLTDEEKIEIIEKYMTALGLGVMFIDEVEAKLKENNNG